MSSAVSTALARLALTRPAYDEAAAMYEGDVREVIASQKVRDLLADQGSAYCVNYARTPVDVLVERTMIQGWTCRDAGHLAAIEQVWADNDLGLEAKDVHRRAYEYGDSYLIGWADEDAPGGVSVYAHDPTGVRVFYDPARPRLKSHAVHTWLEPGDRDEDGNGLPEGVWRRVNLYYPDRVERYVSRTEAVTVTGQPVRAVDDDQWRDYDDDGDDALVFYADEGMPDVVPVFHFRTARPYGRPEHADAYAPQRGINKLMESMMAAVDFQILPKRVVMTDSAIEENSRLAPNLFPEDGSGSDTGLSSDSDISDAPGDVWLLSGKNVRASQFDAADMNNFLLPKNDLVDSMAAVCDLPLDRFRPAGGQEPSGESKRMSEIPLNKKTSDRFAQFGVTWREFASWAVGVAQGSLAPVEVDAQVAWAPPETYSDQASWATAEAQLRAGVPYEQVMRERGYSSDLVAQWSAARVVPGVVETEDPDVSQA